MSIANLWDRIADAGPAAVVLVAATLALLAIPLLRWLAPHGQRHGGGPAARREWVTRLRHQL